ncbi:uncharacterized protein [Primulina huaijiensis]|uniref:uncharacterized protein isoform X1 n=1 Tax=Primulina huaijiensis TaxID=1492673 RepID=UPI003CC75192
MASNFSVGSSGFCNRNLVRSEDRVNYGNNAPCLARFNAKEQERNAFVMRSHPKEFLLTNASATLSSKRIPTRALSSMASAPNYGQSILEDNQYPLVKSQEGEMEFNRVDCLVWVLHESARSLSLSIQQLEMVRTGPPVAMAWNGVDVHAWHKHIAYQVPVYALLKAALEVEVFLSHKRSNNPCPVHRILFSKVNFLEKHIENQLCARNPTLVQWFRTTEVPRIAGLFMPLFKKWSMDYAGSGVAGTIVAITCCAAVGKLSWRISCSLFSKSIEDALIELITTTRDLVSVDKLYHLATKAGFEEDFLTHFGGKILPSKNVEDLEFWIGLVQRKLFTAFRRESVTKGKHILSNKVQENSLPILGLFAYLGRETRLFLSRHNVKDLDEAIKDLYSYLECGIIFIYPEFSSLSVYQLLMEVIVDEIGWLDFYSAYNCQLYQERRRSKNPIQAEKEIILYSVFTVCYDVVSGFAHYSSSIQQTLDTDLLEFLLQSQGLLSSCLEEYWAAYDVSSDLQKIGERNEPDSAQSFLINGTKNPSLVMDARQISAELKGRETQRNLSTQTAGPSSNQAGTAVDSGHTTKSTQQCFFRKTTANLISKSVDICVGTQLLFIDILDSLRLLAKKLCGHKVTKRERRKMQRTATDVVTLVPITILMLIPVSAVGHAAILAAIRKYIPSLIPSPYSDDRLDVAKQLKRTKKMEVRRITNEDSDSKVL